MTNYMQLLLDNWMIMTEPDFYFVYAGNMEAPKEVYRMTAEDVEVYAVGVKPLTTDSDSSGTYAVTAEFATPIHAWVAPLLPYPHSIRPSRQQSLLWHPPVLRIHCRLW